MLMLVAKTNNINAVAAAAYHIAENNTTQLIKKSNKKTKNSSQVFIFDYVNEFGICHFICAASTKTALVDAAAAGVVGVDVVTDAAMVAIAQQPTNQTNQLTFQFNPSILPSPAHCTQNSH